MNQPEFSRLFRLDSIAAPRPVSIEADEGERKALARRFGLLDIASLVAEASLKRSGDEVRASGHVSASVVQSCVATENPVPAEVEEDFQIVFRPQPTTDGSDEEIELSEEEMDVVFFSGGAVDLGEAVAESLSLALDPYPRSPEADEALRDAGVKSDEDAAPAGALAGLKDLLEGKQS